MEVSEKARLAARELMRVWGDKPKVFRHWDEAEQRSIDIASCENSPVEGITAVGTVGLSDHDLGLGRVRVELVGAFPTDYGFGPNIAATCAFNAFKNGLPTQPDAIHPNVVSLYRPASSVPHMLLTNPFLWKDGPQTLEAEDLRIAWLMLVPIADEERSYASKHGVAALTDLLESRQIDVFDLDRPPIV